jgi:hypothetical protein
MKKVDVKNEVKQLIGTYPKLCERLFGTDKLKLCTQSVNTSVLAEIYYGLNKNVVESVKGYVCGVIDEIALEALPVHSASVDGVGGVGDTVKAWYATLSVDQYDVTKLQLPVMSNDLCPFVDGEGLEWLIKCCKINEKYVRGSDGERDGWMRWYKNVVKSYEKEVKTAENNKKELMRSMGLGEGGVGGDVDLDSPAMQIFLQSFMPFNNIDNVVRNFDNTDVDEGVEEEGDE